MSLAAAHRALYLVSNLGAYIPAYLAKRDRLAGGSGRSLAYVLGNMLRCACGFAGRRVLPCGCESGCDCLVPASPCSLLLLLLLAPLVVLQLAGCLPEFFSRLPCPLPRGIVQRWLLPPAQTCQLAARPHACLALALPLLQRGRDGQRRLLPPTGGGAASHAADQGACGLTWLGAVARRAQGRLPLAACRSGAALFWLSNGAGVRCRTAWTGSS